MELLVFVGIIVAISVAALLWSVRRRVAALERRVEALMRRKGPSRASTRKLAVLEQRVAALEMSAATETRPVATIPQETSRPVAGHSAGPAAMPAPDRPPAAAPSAGGVAVPTQGSPARFSVPAPAATEPLTADVPAEAEPAALRSTPSPGPGPTTAPGTAASVASTVWQVRPATPTRDQDSTVSLTVDPTVPPVVSRLVRRLGDQLRQEGWETVVGGSWLNKLGVLVLVVGIALFIGYSLTQLGPSGRVTVGLAAGATLLGAGIRFERKPRYTVFGRGLIAGGWGAIYFTTYAMHGLDAARVIADPVPASAALLLVASGLIVHSLRYGSQTVTGLAYIIGFATLAVAPLTAFGLFATVPLAASLLWVAWRFSWVPMAVLGLVTTYGTYFATIAPEAPAAPELFVRHQLVLGTYWLLFESFDVLTDAAAPAHRGGRLLFPLNACGFLGLSLLSWSANRPADVYIFLASTAAIYLVSAVARALLVRRAAGPGEPGTITAADNLTYRPAVTVAAALATAGAILRFSGPQLNVALLLVGQMLFLAGLRFRDPYLRWLAACVFLLPVGKSALVDPEVTRQIPLAGWNVHAWTPAAALTAAVLYLNRTLSNTAVILPERAYRACGSALLVLVTGFEAPPRYAATAWFALGLAFFQAGLRNGLREFRAHAYLTGSLALLAVGTVNLIEIEKGAWLQPALPALVACVWLIRLEVPGRAPLADAERRVWWRVCAWSGTVLAAMWVWTITPDNYVGAGWLLLALALFELGLRRRFTDLRSPAYALALIAAVGAYIFTGLARHGGETQALALTTLLLAIAAGRLHLRRCEQLEREERNTLRWLSSLMATLFFSTLVWHVVPRAWVALAWLTVALLLLELAIRLTGRHWTYQAYAVAALATATLFVDAFPVLVEPGPFLSRITTGSLLYAYAFVRVVRLSSDRLPARDTAGVRDASAFCAAALIEISCWQLLPAPAVAIALGIVGLLLLDLGFLLRVPSLRVYGHITLGLMLTRLLLANLTGTGMTAGVSHRVLTVVPIVGLLYYLAAWLKRMTAADRALTWEHHLPRLYLYLGTGAAVVLMRFELGRTVATAGWSLMVLALLTLGIHRDNRDLRWQSYLIAGLTFIRARFTGFYAPESLAGSADLMAAAVVIGSLYAAQLLYPTSPSFSTQPAAGPIGWLLGYLDGHARPMFSLMATVLLATLLFNETSAGRLTMAWAVQGTALLGAGFLVRDRILRWSGLVLLAICTLKVFAYDFRQLDTFSRILSFIVLGLLMLAASWCYARYSERLRRYL